MEFFRGGTTLIGTVTTSPYTFVWTNVAIGNYSLSAKATDSAGGTRTSTAVAITVKANVLPTVSISSPAANASFPAPANISITATATDTDGTIAKVDFLNGATLLGTVTAAPFTFAWNGVAAGSYSFTAKATDNSGGVKTSTAVAVTVTPPPPTVSITSPASGTTFVAPASISISANATPASGATISKVDFFNGATLLGTKTTAPYSFNWTGVVAGTYSLTAKATDSRSATATSSAVSVTVTPTPPTVGLTSPANNATFAAPATIALAATATPASGATISKVEFFNGATLITSDTSSPYSFSWTNVAAGTYSLTAKATDSKGATATSSVITVTVTPPPPPTVTLTSPANNATFSPPATIALAATATPASGATTSKVEFFNGTTLLNSDTTSPYSFSWTNVAAGTYSLTAKATDSKGAVATTAPATVTVQVPRTPPTVAITSPTSGATFAGPTSIAITATAAATQSGATINKVDFYNGATLLGTISGAGPYTYNWTGVGAGGYLLSARATDSLGTSTTSSLVYAIVDGADTCVTAPPLTAAESATKLASLANLPLTFEANAGRSPANVRFQLRRPGYQLYLTSSESVLALDGASSKSVAVRMKFHGAAADPSIVGLEEVAGKSNYLIGRDTSKWISRVPQYSKVRYEGIYPGIDKVFHGSEGKLEYDLNVAPGANPASIRFALDGIEAMTLDEDGDLVLQTAAGTLVQKKPVAYQEIDGVRHGVEASYLVAANEVAFALGRYDATRPLVIDPVLVYSTYLGATNNSTGANAIALSRCGEVFIGGFTYASDYPTTAGAFDRTAITGTQMGFVSKLNQAGTALLYSTFVTGTTGDSPPQSTEVLGIAVDATGHAFVTGNTSASDFPTTPGSPNPAQLLSPSTFMSKLNTDGSAFMYSTYVNAVNLVGIALDPTGGAYATGNRGVWKLNASGSAFDYSFLVGGSGNPNQGLFDSAQAVAVDSAGNAYVAGITYSPDLPVTAGAFQQTRPTASTNSSGFLAKINPAGTALVYGSYLGTAGNVVLYGLALDNAGAAYVTGMADLNASIPNLTGTYKSFNANIDQSGNLYALAAKVKPDGSNLNYFSRIGGSSCGSFSCSYAQTFGFAVAVDPSGSAWIAGTTGSNELPLVKPLYSNFATAFNGPDLFAAKLSSSGTSLLLSTLLNGQTPGVAAPNGPGSSTIGGIAVDPIGSAYIAGWTDKVDFPTTPGAYQSTLASNQVVNAFVAKINETKDTATTLTVSPIPGSVGTAQTFTATVTGNAPTGTVTFLNGGTSIGTATVSGGIAQLVTSTLAAGPYTVTASYGGDARNNASSSTAVVFNVSNPTAVPTITLTGIADGAALVTNSGGVYTGARVTATATAATGNLLTELRIYFGAGYTLWTMSQPSVTQPWGLPDLSPGAYVVYAAAIDNYGHTVTTPPIRFVVNSTGAAAPSVALTAPANGSTLTAPGPFTLSATASAAGSATISSVMFYAGGTIVGSSTTSPYSSPWYDAAPGSYSLMALATDSAGTRSFSVPVAVTVVSPPPPTVALTAPANGATYWTTDTIALAATASGNGGATISKVEFYGDGTLLGVAANPPYAFSWTTPDAGTHALTAKAYDSRNVTATSTAVTVTVAVPPVPTIAITSPANGASFPSPASIPITVNAAAGSGGSITRVDFYNGTTLIGTAPSAPWGFTWSNVVAGSYSLTAAITDSRSATATSAAVNVTVVLGQLMVTADAGIDGASISDDNTLISGTIQAPANSAVTVNGQLATVTQDGHFFVNAFGLQPGVNSLTLTVNTPDDATASQNISLSSGGSGLFKVTVTPTEGIAPLDVAFTVDNPSNTPFASIEFDINGDGAVDYTATSIGTANPIFTLGPGVSRAKVSMKRADGSVIYTATQMIYVYTAVDKYNLVKGVFDGMIDRLKAGNGDGASLMFVPSRRDAYKAIFAGMGASLASSAAQFGTVRTGSISDNFVELVVVHDTSDGPTGFPIHLIRNADGIWRIEGM